MWSSDGYDDDYDKVHTIMRSLLSPPSRFAQILLPAMWHQYSRVDSSTMTKLDEHLSIHVDTRVKLAIKEKNEP